MGAGGDIFVQAGATLTIEGNSTTSIAAGQVAGGSAINGSTAGQGFGAGIYLQGPGAVVTLNSNGTSETIAAPIDDDKGSATKASYTAPAGYTVGSVGITKSGVGTVTLSAGNSYTGPTTISAGTLVLSAVNTITGTITIGTSSTLEVGAAGSVGSSFVSFGTTATLQIDAAGKTGGAVALPNYLSGLARGDTLDLRDVPYVVGASTVLSGNALTVTDGTISEKFLFTSSAITGVSHVYSDGQGGSFVVCY